jgi:hypothetical protein
MEDVGILYDHLVCLVSIWQYFTVFWYISIVIWYILPVWVSFSKKNLATLQTLLNIYTGRIYKNKKIGLKRRSNPGLKFKGCLGANGKHWLTNGIIIALAQMLKAIVKQRVSRQFKEETSLLIMQYIRAQAR